MAISLDKRTFQQFSWLRTRYGVAVLFLVFFLGLEFAVRVALLIKAAPFVSWDLSLLATFGWGVVYDIGAACWFALVRTMWTTHGAAL